MKDIRQRLQVVPVSRCLSHEGIVARWVDQIAANIKDQGVMKNPVIVSRHKSRYIVLDGMHRFAAIQKLGIRDILVCEYDYFSEEIRLDGWDALFFRKFPVARLLTTLFPKKDGFEIRKVSSPQMAKNMVRRREVLLVMGNRDESLWGVFLKSKPAKGSVEMVCHVADKLDRYLSDAECNVIYVDNDCTVSELQHSHASGVIFRPTFTKEEVLERTLGKKLFPPKSTRHLIPARPIRVDLDLSLLRSKISLKVKNRLLQDHLRWCYENNRVRYYPESVYVFSD